MLIHWSKKQLNSFDRQRIEMQRDWHWQVHDAIYKPSLEIKMLLKKEKLIYTLEGGLRHSDKTRL